MKLFSYSSPRARNQSEAMYASLWQGLTGAWFPEMGNTGGIVPDLSGHGHDGITTDYSTPWVQGPYGPMLNHTADYSRLRISTATIPPLSQTRGSVSCWVRRVNQMNYAYRHLWNIDNASNNSTHELQTQNYVTNTLRFTPNYDQSYLHYWEWSESSAKTDTVLPAGELIHLAVAWDRAISTIRGWKNGVIYGTQGGSTWQASAWTSNEELVLGGNYGSLESECECGGWLTYDRMLTDAEVSLLFADHFAPFRKRLTIAAHVPAAAPPAPTLLPAQQIIMVS